ncbi:protein CD300H isoform X1 [Canis lupus familiaris]|uniref:protein CD300H isoform X1 n=1 Tax=Canis lupus familiaris TaxID=9615 RepID=UPI0018F711C8|nr:protein CD300H isoform X1 [Canis lupus familiaris]
MTTWDWMVWLPAALLLLQVPGCSSLRGPDSVSGTVGGSLSVRCQYKEGFRDHDKYWCKSPCVWKKIVETTESQREVTKGRVSIRDHPADLTFTVTLKSLTEGDAGTYKCGIDTLWVDPTFSVVVSVTPGDPSSGRPTSSSVLSTILPASTWSTTTPQETSNSRQRPGERTFPWSPAGLRSQLSGACRNQSPRTGKSKCPGWRVILLKTRPLTEGRGPCSAGSTSCS